MIWEIQVGAGELLDKYSILCLKELKITDSKKRKNICEEKNRLAELCEPILRNSQVRNLFYNLYVVNKFLWRIEDDLRQKEKEQDFGDSFVQLARQVYFTNDDRSRIKREINLILNSKIIEEKQHPEYK